MANSLTIFRQSLACLPVLLNVFVIGLGCQIMVPRVFRYRYDAENDGLSELSVLDEEPGIEIVLTIGAMGKIFAILITPLFVDKFGRRLALNLITIMLFVVSLLTIYLPTNRSSLYTNGTASRSLPRNNTRTPHIHDNWYIEDFSLYINNSTSDAYFSCARNAMFNLAYEMCNIIVSGIYVIENCSPNFRGVVGSGTALMFAAGSCAHYVMSQMVDLSNSSIAITNAVLITVGVFPMTWYCSIETPSFLTMKGRRRKAEQNLLWLSGTTSYTEVTQELRRIENTLVDEQLKMKSLRLLFSSVANWKGLLLVLGLHLGMWNYAFKPDAVLIELTHDPMDWVKYGRVRGRPKMWLVFLPILPLFVILVGPFINEWVNRRSLVIRCYCGIAFINFFIFLSMLSVDSSPSTRTLPIGFVHIFIFVCVSFSFCLKALMYSAIYAFKEEMLPFSVRAIGCSIGALGLSIPSLYKNKLYGPITRDFGEGINYLIFTVLASLSSTIFYHFAPKPRGETLHELQNSQRIKHVDRRFGDDDAEEEITRL